jgi:5-methylcytosine-specific restriction endonuclease McrA
VKAKKREYARTPEARAKNRAYKQQPEWKAKASEYNRQWYAENRERHLATSRRWHAQNPEAVRVKAARHFAKRHGVESTLTESEWLAILDERGRQCVYCGDPFECIEHIVPMSKGGANSADNVAPSCIPCNASKRDEVWAVPA